MFSATRICLMAVAAIFIVAAGEARAQTVHGTLRDVGEMVFVMQPLDEEARSCGLTVDGLSAAAAKGMKGAGFQLGGYDYSLYLRVVAMPEGDKCFSSVDLEVRYLGRMPLPAYPKGNVVRAVLWSSGNIILSLRAQHSAEAEALVTRLVRALAADWARDNAQQKAG